jgi:hypothetical protein
MPIKNLNSITVGESNAIDVKEIAWNPVDGTFNMGLLNDVVLQAGQEMHFYGKATEAISNGDAVMFAGAEGDHVLMAKATQAVINANPEYFIGVATQNFTTNQYGYVTSFGSVRDLDTTIYRIAPDSSEGNILYFDSAGTTPGALTITEPVAPNAKIRVAAVTRDNANVGVILVRPMVEPKLDQLQDMSIVSKTDGDVLVWNDINKYWFNDSTLNVDYTNGRVGIGTTSPDSILHIKNSAAPELKLESSVTTYNTVSSKIGFYGGYDSNLELASIRVKELSSGGIGGGLSIFTTVDPDTPQEIITINSLGRVGIGTTGPSEKFHVSGNILATGTILGSNLSGTNTGDQDLSGYALTSHNHDGVYQPAGTYNTIIGTDLDIDTSGATIIDNIYVTDGVITSMGTRTLTLGDLGYTGATNANNYVHPTHPGDDINLDTGALTGATIISDLDFNVTTDTLGHVTDANAAYSTRNLTATDIGAAAASHNHDDRYYTESESDSRFVNVTGDTMTGTLSLTSDTPLVTNDNHYVNRRFTMIENASPQWILLCVNGANNDVNGTIRIDRTSGNYQAVALEVIVSAGSASMFGGALRSLQVLQNSEDYRLVSVTYNGINYIAIKYTGNTYPMTTGSYFTGRLVSTGTALTVVSSGITNEASFGGNSEQYFDIDTVATSGEFYAQNSQKVFHDNYHPNADKWTTARTLSLTGDVSGSVSWDGSGNASITTVVANNSHTHTWANINGETANSVNGWGGLRHQTNDGYIDFGPANTGHAHIYTDRPNFYFNKALTVNGQSVINTGDIRSSIFYDLDDTGYYVNPAGNSQFSAIYYNEWLRNNRSTATGLYWEGNSPGSGWHIYPQDQRDMTFRTGSGNGGIKGTIADGTARGYVHWTTSNEIGFLNNSRSWSLRVDASGNTFSTASSRAPVFYDSDNTSYYLNPASTGISANLAGKAYFTSTNSSIFMGQGRGVQWSSYNYDNPAIYGSSNFDGLYVGSMSGASGFSPVISVHTYDQQVGINTGTSSLSYDLQLANNSAAKPSSIYWSTTSDERVKENIQDYNKGLNEILQIRPVTFDYNGKGGFEKTKNNIGVIAQELMIPFPEAVNTHQAKLNADDEEKTELYNVDFQSVTFALINSIKELQTKIEQLETRIQTLENNN